MPLTHFTLTGVDESTSLQGVASLSAEFTLAEGGFLYSPKRQGAARPIPPVSMIKRAFADLPAHVRVALHVCGAGVADLLNGNDEVTRGLVGMVGDRGGRVQLNFNFQRGEIDLLLIKNLLDIFPAVTFITQHNPANIDVLPALREHRNHAILFDASGGRGLSPNEWATPLNGVRCGYAGGLGLDNIADQMVVIKDAVGEHPFWVDMEGKLRDENDCFSLDLSRLCLVVASR